MTPLALPHHNRQGRDGASRAAAEIHLSSAVVDALRHSGFPYHGVRVRVQPERFFRNGDLAPAFASGRFAAATLYHVQVTFPEPIKGPLVLGDGRWLGLGVMAPAFETPAPVHVFRISGGTWPVSDTPLITRAVRRAVMSLVADAIGGSRSLPTFFTGHDEINAPVMGDVHEHLFFLAYDSDGDGVLDLVAVVAPHLVDRRSTGSSYLSETRLLARALERLQVVRAGRLGVMKLQRLETPPDDLFSPGTTWVSVTRYRPTRHPKRGAAPDAVLVADLVTECARRGLPTPHVTVLALTEGPRRGLSCHARLTFAHPVRGPLILGPGSHFGEGLFRRAPVAAQQP